MTTTRKPSPAQREAWDASKHRLSANKPVIALDGCVHHWQLEPQLTAAKGRCVKCGETKFFDGGVLTAWEPVKKPRSDELPLEGVNAW